MCNGSTPNVFSLVFNGNSSYTSPKVSSTDQTTAQLNVSGLASSDAQFGLSGTYAIAGKVQSKIGEQKTFDGTLTFALSDIKLDKLTKQILSGTATVKVAVVGLDGSGSKNAVVTFLGAGKATVVLEGGASYNVNI